jgi:hypothetical protein
MSQSGSRLAVGLSNGTLLLFEIGSSTAAYHISQVGAYTLSDAPINNVQQVQDTNWLYTGSVPSAVSNTNYSMQGKKIFQSKNIEL